MYVVVVPSSVIGHQTQSFCSSRVKMGFLLTTGSHFEAKMIKYK